MNIGSVMKYSRQIQMVLDYDYCGGNTDEIMNDRGGSFGEYRAPSESKHLLPTGFTLFLAL